MKGKWILLEDGFPCRKKELFSGEKAFVEEAGTTPRSLLFDAAAALFVPDILLPHGDIFSVSQKTAKALGASIGGAMFLAGRYAVSADFLLPLKDGSYELILVRETARVHGRQIREAALAAVFAEKNGFPVSKLTVAFVSSDFIREESVDPGKLICQKDVTSDAERYRKDFRNELDLRLSDEEAGKEILSESCFSGTDCPFIRNCAGRLPFPSVFDVFGMSGKEKMLCYEKGIVSFRDLTDNGILNASQERQLRMTGEGRGEEYEQIPLHRWLRQLKQPVCFLDFEGIASAVPPFEGMKPFETLPFAFSYHDAAGNCTVFLGEPETDPRRDMAEALISLIPEPGTVFAYDKNYENSVLKLLSSRFPYYRQPLEAIRRSLIDLSDPFRNGWYYASGMNGSVSLKSVAPAMFPEEPSLSYGVLSEVKNGSDAVETYRRLPYMNAEERRSARMSLTEYSRMDTYTMLRIYGKLMRIAIGEGDSPERSGGSGSEDD